MVFTHTLCVSTVYSGRSPESCEQISQACYLGGIRTRDPCIFRAVSYQLDFRGCPAARGSLSPMFWSRVPQRLNTSYNLLIVLQTSIYFFDVEFKAWHPSYLKLIFYCYPIRKVEIGISTQNTLVIVKDNFIWPDIIYET